MTKEVFAQYKEIEQKIKGLREKLSGNHDKEIEDELVRTENIRISLEHEYDWQDRIFDDEKGLFGMIFMRSYPIKTINLCHMQYAKMANGVS